MASAHRIVLAAAALVACHAPSAATLPPPPPAAPFLPAWAPLPQPPAGCQSAPKLDVAASPPEPPDPVLDASLDWAFSANERADRAEIRMALAALAERDELTIRIDGAVIHRRWVCPGVL